MLRDAASRRSRAAGSLEITSGINGKPTQSIDTCRQSSPVAFTASKRVSNVGREKTPRKIPICMIDAFGLPSPSAAPTSDSAAKEFLAQVTPTARSPVVLSIRRRVQRALLFGVEVDMGHHRVARGSRRPPFYRFAWEGGSRCPAKKRLNSLDDCGFSPGGSEGTGADGSPPLAGGAFWWHQNLSPRTPRLAALRRDSGGDCERRASHRQGNRSGLSGGRCLLSRRGTPIGRRPVAADFLGVIPKSPRRKPPRLAGLRWDSGGDRVGGFYG